MADLKISELLEGNLIRASDDLIVVREGVNYKVSLYPVATLNQARGNNSTPYIFTPAGLRAAVLSNQWTANELNTRIDGRITAHGVETWARSGGGPIPTNRLGNSVNYVHTWARASSSALIPLNRLTNAVDEAANRVESWARVGGGLIPLSELPLNAVYEAGAWDATTTYRRGAIVAHASEHWLAIASNQNATPSASATQWVQITGGGTGTGDDAFDWATVGNTDDIPVAKLGEAASLVWGWARASNTGEIPAYKFAAAYRARISGNGVSNYRTGAGWGMYPVAVNAANLPDHTFTTQKLGVLRLGYASSSSSGAQHLNLLIAGDLAENGGGMGLWAEVRDGSTYSGWARLDNGINTPSLAFVERNIGEGEDAVSTPQLDFIFKDSKGADQRASITVPDSYRNEAHTAEFTPTGTSPWTVSVQFKDRNNGNVGSPVSFILQNHIHSQANWNRTAAQQATYQNIRTIISPKELTDTIIHVRPSGTNAEAEANPPNNAATRLWTAESLHRAARVAIPDGTLAQITTGTDGTSRKYSPAVLKSAIETLGGSSGGGGGSGSGVPVKISSGTWNFPEDNTNGRLEVSVPNWENYNLFYFVSFSGVVGTTHGPILKEELLENSAVTLNSSSFDFNSNTSLLAEVFLQSSNKDLAVGRKDSNTFIVGNLTSAGPTYSLNYEIWAVSLSGAGAVVAAGAPYITYAHAGAPDLQAFYRVGTSASQIYPSDDVRAGGENIDIFRKFVAGDIKASSRKDGDGNPIALLSSDLAWATGDRSGVDSDLGEPATADVLDNSVFSLDGTWKVVCNITIDNMQAAGTRLRMLMRKVNETGDADDIQFFANAAEIGGTGFPARSSSPEQQIHDNVSTIRLELPWTVFDPDDKYYVVWSLDREDTESLHRIFNAYLEFEKRP